MVGKLKTKPATRRDAADAVRLKAEGAPSHINAREARLLEALMPEAAGPVITKGLLAEAGRYGDDRVTRLIPAEAALLKARGGSGTVNPSTGLLEYGDGMGGSDNPGGGHNGDTGPGSPGSGGGGYGGPSSSPGDSYGDRAGVGFGFGAPTDPGRGLSINDISNFGGIGVPGAGTIGPRGEMDSFASRPGDLSNYGLASEYAPLDTIQRLVQTAIFGPPKQYNPTQQMPGQYGMPNARGPGVVGKGVAAFGGPAMSAAMTLGGWMRDSMSPEAQDASMRANEEQGTKNSTGQDRDSNTGLSVADLEKRDPGTQFAGTASGAQTARVPAGYTVNAAGQMIPAGNNRPAYQDPIKNLLYDYILRGRQGSGFGW